MEITAYYEKTVKNNSLATILNKKGAVRLDNDDYHKLKADLHHRMLSMMDLAIIDSLDEQVVRQKIRHLMEELLLHQSEPLNSVEKERLIAEVEDEIMGLGPLEPYLRDPTVSEILVNAHDQIYIERFGKLEPTDSRFKDDVHLRMIIDKIVSAVGRRIDESSPMVDARLADGSRVNAIIPPLAIDGPCVSIRRFAVEPLQLEDLIVLKALTPEIGELLRGIVQARLNVLISGGTGSGKTTLLNVISGFIPPDERIITIEDSAELQLRQGHVVRLETKPPNIEGKGEFTQRDLVRNCLRMRPDRIVMGEVRAGEALDMLQAMNTGHDGSLTTIHANTPRDSLIRLETMVAMAGLNIPTKFLRHHISSALDVIIQVARHSDGSRKLTSIQEIVGMEGEIITLQEIFRFEQTGLTEERKVRGRFMATGIRPRFAERFKALGIDVSPDIFDPRNLYEI
ncbi:MAG: CpaF family protein [bacterium]|nr:CpaF family protein [bacterium]